MLPVIPLTYRCALHHYDGVGGDTVNVIHVQSVELMTPTEVWNILDANNTSAMWGELSDQYGGFDCSITPLDGETPTQTFAPTNARWQGGAAGNAVPEAAWGLTLQTGKRGKSYTGRLFIGPATESQIDGGRFGSTGVAAATAAWGTFLNDIVGVELALVVASYKLATAEQVTNVVGRTGVRTQRKRLVRARGTG